uniref:FERM N-terminal domain-containing protein n=1 Tax=Parascaris equorum TaxID=6256 RepID=A0A914R7X5_PAREQ
MLCPPEVFSPEAIISQKKSVEAQQILDYVCDFLNIVEEDYFGLRSQGTDKHRVGLHFTDFTSKHTGWTSTKRYRNRSEVRMWHCSSVSASIHPMSLCLKKRSRGLVRKVLAEADAVGKSRLISAFRATPERPPAWAIVLLSK